RAREASLPGHRDTHPRIHDERALGAVRDDQRVDVHLLDLGELGDQRRETQERLLDEGEVGGALAPGSGQEWKASYRADHLAGLDVRDRMDSDGDVAQDLDVDPAQTEEQQMPEL